MNGIQIDNVIGDKKLESKLLDLAGEVRSILTVVSKGNDKYMIISYWIDGQ